MSYCRVILFPYPCGSFSIKGKNKCCWCKVLRHKKKKSYHIKQILLEEFLKISPPIYSIKSLCRDYDNFKGMPCVFDHNKIFHFVAMSNKVQSCYQESKKNRTKYSWQADIEQLEKSHIYLCTDFLKTNLQPFCEFIMSSVAVAPLYSFYRTWKDSR